MHPNLVRPRRHGGRLGLLLIASSGIALASCADSLPPRKLTGDAGAELAFSTYLGEGSSTLRSAGFDADGNVFVAGGTQSGVFPGQEERLGEGGGWDAVVAKLSPDGQLLWARVLGGPHEDYAYVSAVHPEGDIVIGGRAGAGFPVTPGAADTSFGGGRKTRVHGATDGFVARLSRDGELLWASYVGGSGNENTRAIHWLADGAIAIGGGNSRSRDLPTDAGTLPGPVLKPTPGGEIEAWVGVVAADGASFDFLTYFGPDDEGGKRDETIRALGEDSAGNLWLGGTTPGRDMIPTSDAFQPERGNDETGAQSAYVAKLSRDGRRLVYFSWLGGNGNEEIETEGGSDAAGRFYLAGATTSTDFPVTSGAHADSGSGSSDAWVARIEDDGSLGFAARYGGSENDAFFGPGSTPDGGIVTGGRMRSPDAATTEGALQERLRGRQDGNLAVFGPGGALRHASYFGGSDFDSVRFVATSADGARCVLVGETHSSDLPLKAAAQSRPGGVYVAVWDLVWPKAGE